MCHLNGMKLVRAQNYMVLEGWLNHAFIKSSLDLIQPLSELPCFQYFSFVSFRFICKYWKHIWTSCTICINIFCFNDISITPVFLVFFFLFLCYFRLFLWLYAKKRFFIPYIKLNFLSAENVLWSVVIHNFQNMYWYILYQ